MEEQPATGITKGQWLALTAALLGWMFDGLEMGLFPLVGRPALRDLLGSQAGESDIGRWFSIATAGFLVGAATGGVLFGWLGDRLGRVRAMTLSVLVYAIFSGMCGLANEAWQVAVLRFLSALGMGGEWSLGVALVMEIWPNRSRALLAGLIGAAANLGYMLIAILGLGLGRVLHRVGDWLTAVGLSEITAAWLTAHSGWRLLMLMGAAPAFLTLFIRLFVPESERWQEEQRRGTTSHWAVADLLGVKVGAVAACGLIILWALDVREVAVRIGTVQTWALYLCGSLLAVVVIILAYLYPVVRFVQRADAGLSTESELKFTVGRMLLAAGLSGIPLLATWAAVQWGPVWADQLADRHRTLCAATAGVGCGSAGAPIPVLLLVDVKAVPKPDWKSYTQFWSSLGAIFGTIAAALLADWIGRRFAYVLMCFASLGSVLLFYLGNETVTAQFMATAFLGGCMTASFYGWLPLYLPELFPTRVRATGQGFGFNFGRILAAMGVMQMGTLVGLFAGYPQAGSIMSLIYVLGVVVIWLAPETRNQPLPE